MFIELTALDAAPACQYSFVAGAAMLLTLFVWKLCRRGRRYSIPLRDITKGHHWFPIDILSHAAFCSVCHSLVVEGWYCDACHVCSDNSCLKVADKKIFCKSLAGTGSFVKHHWVKGNFSADSICDVCEELCGSDEELLDFRCCWCSRTVHTTCRSSLSEICDLGPHKQFIVPPYSIKLKMVGWKGKRHLVVGEVKPPRLRPWTPLVIIANRQSGSNDGDLVLRAFRGVLNPAQVIDLADLPPESGLEWCHLVQGCMVLVAGGDGTVGWVLSAIEKLKLSPHPQVSILPLGTGNDLARVLGWGSGSSGERVDVRETLWALRQAQEVKLDRWTIEFQYPRHLGIRKPSKEVFMVNYASVGVDALVTLKFHQTRQSRFYFFSNRIINKFIYMGYGTIGFLERQCKDLRHKLDLFVDGRQVALPEVEAVVVLNIPSWGAGVCPWSMGSNANVNEQRYDDGILEVIGIYSTFHIAQMQIGLSEPLRLGQGRWIEMRLKERLPVQVDGEPWEQTQATATFRYRGQATMLANREDC